ncbi:hypothetical protein CRENBAI_016266 [Crenichthys baileyi]|uniref:Uncharacterized protein n=1 Tax=Crenichthys baileyi TaxID=28760 RepID=A0AAV9RT86_9TELE
MFPPKLDLADGRQERSSDHWLQQQMKEAMSHLPSDLEVVPSPLLWRRWELAPAGPGSGQADLFTFLSREAEKTLRGCQCRTRLMTDPVKPSSSSRRKKRRRGAPSCVSAGEEESPTAAAATPGVVTPLLAGGRVAASIPASSSATAQSPRLAAAPPMSLAPAWCSEATPDELEQRLRFYARQLKTFRRTCLLYSSPELRERIRQMEEDYETAVRQFYCRPPSPIPSHQSAAAEQSKPGLQNGAAAQSTSGFQGAGTEQPTSGLQSAAAAQFMSGLQSTAAAAQSNSCLQSAGIVLPKSASTSSTCRRGRRKRDASAQVIGGPGDASAQVIGGPGDASAQVIRGPGDVSAQVIRGPGDVSAQVIGGPGDASAQVIRGPGDASAQIIGGLCDASASAHANEALGDASAPAPPLGVSATPQLLLKPLGVSATPQLLLTPLGVSPMPQLLLTPVRITATPQPLASNLSSDEGFEEEAPPDPVSKGFKVQLVLVLASEGPPDAASVSEGPVGSASASEGSPGSASASEGSPGSASASEGSPGHVLEEPVGGLPPRPGPEHLLGFLWGVFMELKPDSWAPPGSKPGSKPPEFREGFKDEPRPIQVPESREGFEDGPPLLPVPEGSVGGLPMTIAPGPSDCVPGQIDCVPGLTDNAPKLTYCSPELTYCAPGQIDFVAGLTDILPKALDLSPYYEAPDSRPDSKLRGSSTLCGRPPDRGSSTLRGRPPDRGFSTLLGLHVFAASLFAADRPGLCVAGPAARLNYVPAWDDLQNFVPAQDGLLVVRLKFVPARDGLLSHFSQSPGPSFRGNLWNHLKTEDKTCPHNLRDLENFCMEIKGFGMICFTGGPSVSTTTRSQTGSLFFLHEAPVINNETTQQSLTLP